MSSSTADLSSLSNQLSVVSEYIDSLHAQLQAISLDIHDHPELRFKEHHAHDILTNFLQNQQGWKVIQSAYGIDTAFVAVFDGPGKGPVVSFNAEYGSTFAASSFTQPSSDMPVDALPGIGHACGHNLIAILSLAASLAVAKLIKDERINGRVVLFGTPAEANSRILHLPRGRLISPESCELTLINTLTEGGGGKIKLLQAGAYSDHKVDISLMAHPGIGPDVANTKTSAFAQFKVEYFGKAAHAADRPWDGINALDALISAINNVSLLRQQTHPLDLIQYRISDGGAKPNIIHAYAAGIFVVRAPTRPRLDSLKSRLHACLEGGATATGATLKVSEGVGYLNHIPNRVLGRQYAKHFIRLGGSINWNLGGSGDPIASTQASTDQGNISHAMPSLTPNFWIRSESADAPAQQLGGPHTPDFERAARTAEAHNLALRVAKALAATALDLLTVPGMIDGVKREFDERQ